MLFDLALASTIMLTLDSIWIGIIMESRYNQVVKNIQGDSIRINIFSACICYMILIFGLYRFVLSQISRFDYIKILSLSIPLGIVTFGTYDFTSADILKNFDLKTAFIDLSWGTSLMTITPLITVFIRTLFFNEEKKSIMKEQ